MEVLLRLDSDRVKVLIENFRCSSTTSRSDMWVKNSLDEVLFVINDPQEVVSLHLVEHEHVMEYIVSFKIFGL